MLELLRKKHKHLFRYYLEKFKIYSQNFDIDPEWKIVQYKSHHKHQSLNILSYQFSCMGGTRHARALMLSVEDHFDALSHELDHLAQTGLGYVILDKHKNVCMITYSWDHCDQPIYTIKNSCYRKKYEICNAALHKDKIYQTLVQNRSDIKYGEVVHCDKIAVRPDLMGKGLYFMDFTLSLHKAMGYTIGYSIQTNPKTVQRSEIKNSTMRDIFHQSSLFDFSSFVFKDGTTMNHHYKQLKQCQFDVEQIKNRSQIAILWIYYYNIEYDAQMANLVKFWNNCNNKHRAKL